MVSTLQLAVFFLCSTIILLLLPSPGSCEDEDTGAYNQLIVPKRNLSCHECYRSVEGEACLTLADVSKVKVTTCAVDELFCVVERYHSDGEMTTFSRKCAKSCEPGCQTAGTYYTEQFCYHCCQQNLCNNVAAHSSGALRTFRGLTSYMTGILAAVWLAK